jgi:hypothetical protein
MRFLTLEENQITASALVDPIIELVDHPPEVPYPPPFN